jgi:hypothetical protein
MKHPLDFDQHLRTIAPAQSLRSLKPFWIVLVALLSQASFVAAELPPGILAEVLIDTNAVAEGTLLVPLRFADHEQALFILDTGSPLTVLDRSLRTKLGKRTDRFVMQAWNIKQTGGVYPAPKLFLGDVPLITGDDVIACEMKKFSPDFPPDIKGILGLDCLQHYCVQIDFAAGKLRLLTPNAAKVLKPGKSFPLRLSNLSQENPYYGRTFIDHRGLVGASVTNMLVDTGFDRDGAEAGDVTNATMQLAKDRWWFREITWEGQTYTNLLIIKAPESVAGRGGTVIGLRFLARHIATFDFPNRLLYLERQNVGPLKSKQEEMFESIYPEDGKLPDNINERLNETIKSTRLPLLAHWFGPQMNLRKFGETNVWHYQLKRDRKNKQWKLEKAWETDPSGNALREILK